jgi:ABC-type lipoprotein release transport system permease subunit
MGEAFLISVLAVIAGFLIGFSVHSYFKHVGLSLDSFYDNEMDFGGVIFDPVIYSDLSVGRIAGSILAVFCLTVILAIIPAVRAARAGDVHLLSSN